jgi:hypothetical protein
MTSSNFVGCSTGRSAGFAPLTLALLRPDERDAGQVATRPGQARDEAGLLRERGPAEHDRDLRGRVLGCERRGSARGAGF